MITATPRSKTLSSLDRLDAWYFLAPGAAAARRIDIAKAEGLRTIPLGGQEGVARLWQPARFKRLFAAVGEESVPYLAPHAGFQYLPAETEHLSRHRIEGIDRLLASPGTILLTCSGRNLGPAFMSDAYTEHFYLSDDLIRILIEDPRMRHYAFAFLQSQTGQGLIRRGKSGSVIDHISPEHLADIELPLLAEDLINEIAEMVGEALRLVEESRLLIAGALGAWESRLPRLDRDAPAKAGYTVRRRAIEGRIDAVPYDPVVRRVRDELRAIGGRPVGEYASVTKLERYKRVYVASEQGSPYLSGSQMLQYKPINQQYLASHAVDDIDKHRIRAGWTLYQADGRVEKGLGVAALVTSDRDRWVASEHVGRVVPLKDTEPGWLWAACRTRQAQIQIKALAIGSVVDTTYPSDMESVLLPPDDGSVDGAGIYAAWESFAAARSLEASASQRIDDALSEIARL